jgi:hypothetical protein
MKKILFCLLCILFISTVQAQNELNPKDFIYPSSDKHDFTVQGFTYQPVKIKGEKLNLVRIVKAEAGGDIIIPGEVEYKQKKYTVVEISCVFAQRIKVTSVVIPDKVVVIGSYAFSECINLTSVTIPNSVREIRYEAFYNCKNLKTVNIPAGVKRIEGKAFSKSGITSITIPDGVTLIGTRAFEGCNNLVSVIIPDGVTVIGDGAFDGCSKLVSVKLPASIEKIGAEAFNGCVNLTDIVIPETLTKFILSAFNGCTSLPDGTIPEIYIIKAAWENTQQSDKLPKYREFLNKYPNSAQAAKAKEIIDKLEAAKIATVEIKTSASAYYIQPNNETTFWIITTFSEKNDKAKFTLRSVSYKITAGASVSTWTVGHNGEIIDNKIITVEREGKAEVQRKLTVRGQVPRSVGGAFISEWTGADEWGNPISIQEIARLDIP